MIEWLLGLVLLGGFVYIALGFMRLGDGLKKERLALEDKMERDRASELNARLEGPTTQESIDMMERMIEEDYALYFPKVIYEVAEKKTASKREN